MTDIPAFAPLSGLIGVPVADNEGVVVGHITDILVDRVGGRIAYMQLHVSSGSGETGRTLTIPWSVLRPPDNGSTQLELRVGRPTLEALMPGG